MTRRRLIEITATAAMVSTIAAAAGGWLWWRERQRRLEVRMDAALARMLGRDLPGGQADRRDAFEIRALMKQGVAPRGTRGRRALSAAVRCGDRELLREALRRGAAVNAGADAGVTPLMEASTWTSIDGKAPLIELLLTRG